MTITEILSSTKDMLSPDDISDILGSDPATIRIMAAQEPTALAPLGPVRLGNRIKFPRMRFINWYYGISLLRSNADKVAIFDHFTTERREQNGRT